MFTKVLIANRGEIALRILRACKELDIPTVAVHSLCDAKMLSVLLADESVCIGGNKPSESYLNKGAILAAADLVGADAIHPGVGFLSENASFAHMVLDHDLSFIGPSPEHIALMGDKLQAKKLMSSLGVPVVPGSDRAVTSVEVASDMAEQIGFPIIFKAACGGGGKGMHVANSMAALSTAFALSRAEAKANFGDDRVFMERFLQNPRHIEVQIIGDSYGNVVHLGDRDCSIQRNHQKLVEEAPVWSVPAEQREALFTIVVSAVKSLGYVGLGTLEFLYENGEFFFMEMNTRLQVEHTVTEMITGIDLVKEQIKVACGEPLSFSQKDVVFSGHAIEYRINAEDPVTFAPSPGRIASVYFPGGFGIRVDSHIYQDYVVPPYYDSLVAKIIVWDKNRMSCLKKSSRVLSEFVVDGIAINYFKMNY